MAIYRGAGGAGDATGDSASEALLVRDLAAQVTADAAAAEAARAAAVVAKNSAETAETNAETAETNAETAETNAETAQAAAASSASGASTSASNASASASTATTQASNASTSASAASGSASAASTSATNAATSATNASNSASAASTSATNASNSASSAATSATNASGSAATASNAATAAQTAETNAELAETNAETAATNAASSASAASTSASNAATSATNASNSASTATTQATNSSNSASAASTSATNASNNASAASTSATNASNSASAASGFADNASDFADAAAASAASIDVSGFMQKSANLSDVTNTSTARTNLGLVIGTNVQAWDADLDTWSTKTAPSGSVVGTSDTQTLTNKTINASQLVNSSVTPDKLSVQSQYTGFKNRIINGAMLIDQRNSGASVTIPGSGYYTVDRFSAVATQASKMSFQQSTVAPVGFINSLAVTSLSAYTVVSTDAFSIDHRIEGFNVADLGWGTANAQTVTLSFWVRSSLTGTFGGAILNGAGNRSYPFSYTITSANTYEYKTITIAGDTTGTWVTNNGLGLRLSLGLGVGSTYNGTAGSWSGNLYLSSTGATSVVGTNGATFYITGVQLEKGSTATSFDYEDYTSLLAKCQRYYWRIQGETSTFGFASIGTGTAILTTTSFLVQKTPVRLRVTPTLSFNGTIQMYPGTPVTSILAVFSTLNSDTVFVQVGNTGGLTIGQCVTVYTNNTSNDWFAFSAEL